MHESSNLSRDNLSREIGRKQEIVCRLSSPPVKYQTDIIITIIITIIIITIIIIIIINLCVYIYIYIYNT